MKMKKIVSVLLCALLLISALPMNALAEEATASTMRLEKCEGTVTVKNASGKALKITEKMRLYNGYEITTSTKSYAYISLDGTKAVKLDASTKVSVTKAGKKLEILVSSGQLLFDVSEPLDSDESLEIRTSTSLTGVRGTVGYVTVTSPTESVLTILEGVTEVTTVNPVTGKASVTQVSSGQQLSSLIAPEDGGETITVVVSDIAPEEIPGFVLTYVAENPEVQERIEENSDLQIQLVVANAEEIQKLEEAESEKKEQELQQKAENLTTDEVDPLFEQTNTPSEPVIPIIPTPTPTPTPTPDPEPTPTPDPEPEPEPTEFTVTFETNDPNWKIDPITVTAGELIPAPTSEPPAVEGYTFGGWTTENGNPNTLWDFTNDTVTGDTTLYALWNLVYYNVTFNLNNPIVPIEPYQSPVSYGTPISSLPIPTVEGYVFDGWYKDADCSDAWQDNEPIFGEITVYAKWLVIVTFTTEGYGDPVEKSVEEGYPITDPPEFEGLYVEAWYLDKTFTELWDFETMEVTEPITLYADWSFIVTFDMGESGETTELLVHAGEYITDPPEPIPPVDECMFAGWFTEDGTELSLDKPVTEPLTFYPKWSVTVFFDLNMEVLEESIESQDIIIGEKINEPDAALLPSVEGFAFVGWYTTDDLTEQWNFETPVSEGMTLYAKWAETVTVTFKLVMEIPGFTIEPQTVIMGEKIIEPEVPAVEGYLFNAWITADGTPWAFKLPVEKDMTLLASWTPVSRLTDPTLAELNTALSSDASNLVIVEATDLKWTQTDAADAVTVPEGKELILNSGNILFDATMTVSGTLIVKNDLTVNGGTITTTPFISSPVTPCGIIHVKGTMAVNGGSIINNGQIEVDGTMTVSSGSITSLPSSTTETTAFRSISISSSGSMTIGSAATIENNHLSVDGTLTNSGTITSSSENYAVTNFGTFIMDNGSINATQTAVLNNMGTFTMTGGKITNASTGIVVYGNSVTKIEGGEISGSKYGIYDEQNSGGNSTVIISGGSVTSTGTAIAFPVNGGDVIISGGTVSGTECAIDMTSGSASLSITGGTITSSNTILIANGAYSESTWDDGTVIKEGTRISGTAFLESTATPDGTEPAETVAIKNGFSMTGGTIRIHKNVTFTNAETLDFEFSEQISGDWHMITPIAS